MTTDKDLKPCPECGGILERNDLVDMVHIDKGLLVSCRTCDFSDLLDIASILVGIWNTRHQVEKSDDE